MSAQNEGATCPACRGPLRAAPLRWNVLTCDACGGVWADRAAADRIANVVDHDLLIVGREAAKRAEVVAIGSESRACPVCAKPLARMKVADVSLDMCAEHGTWYDRDELGRVSRNRDHARKSHENVAPLPPRRELEDSMSVQLVDSLLGD